MLNRKKLIFDTSAINALADDSDAIAIIRSLAIAHHVGVTETVLAEVIASSEEERRRSLLGVLDRLVHGGHCIMPFRWIIEHQAKAYHRNPQTYEWRGLNVRFAAGEREVSLQEIAHTMSEETRNSNRQWNQQFIEIFSRAKPEFQKLFADPAETRPSLRDVTEHLMSGGGAYLTIAAGLMERATGIAWTEAHSKDFIDRCPPFRAILIALCSSQYDRCIRDEKQPSPGKAGRYDMFSAVYLPYCRIFVTHDEGQWKALMAVAELIGLDVVIRMFSDFKSGLIGLPDAQSSVSFNSGALYGRRE